jgi:hypothetical protein
MPTEPTHAIWILVGSFLAPEPMLENTLILFFAQ